MFFYTYEHYHSPPFPSHYYCYFFPSIQPEVVYLLWLDVYVNSCSLNLPGSLCVLLFMFGPPNPMKTRVTALRNLKFRHSASSLIVLRYDSIEALLIRCLRSIATLLKPPTNATRTLVDSVR